MAVQRSIPGWTLFLVFSFSILSVTLGGTARDQGTDLFSFQEGIEHPATIPFPADYLAKILPGLHVVEKHPQISEGRLKCTAVIIPLRSLLEMLSPRTQINAP